MGEACGRFAGPSATREMMAGGDATTTRRSERQFLLGGWLNQSEHAVDRKTVARQHDGTTGAHLKVVPCHWRATKDFLRAPRELAQVRIEDFSRCETYNVRQVGAPRV